MNYFPRYFKLNFFVIFFLVIWDALRMYFSLTAPVTQALFLAPVVALGLFANFNKIYFKTIFSLPCVIWLLWIFYSLANTFLINGFHPPVYQQPIVFISAILLSFFFFTIIVSCNEDTYDLINVLIFSFLIRLLLSYYFDSSEMIGNDIISRFGVEFNSNAIAFGALFVITLIFLNKNTTNLNINIINVIIFSLSIVTIIITGSKKTFISLIIYLIGLIVIHRLENPIKNIIKTVFFICIVYIAVNWSLQNTTVGLRIIDTIEKSQSAVRVEQMLDSRASFYIDGWKIFLENPINGIGLTNFAFFNNSFAVLHTEYMVQLTECGLIGTLLSAWFYIYIIINLLKIRNYIAPLNHLAELHLLSLLVMFTLFWGMWIYNTPFLWTLIALAVRFIKETQINFSNSYTEYF